MLNIIETFHQAPFVGFQVPLMCTWNQDKWKYAEFFYYDDNCRAHFVQIVDSDVKLKLYEYATVVRPDKCVDMHHPNLNLDFINWKKQRLEVLSKQVYSFRGINLDTCDFIDLGSDLTLDGIKTTLTLYTASKQVQSFEGITREEVDRIVQYGKCHPEKMFVDRGGDIASIPPANFDKTKYHDEQHPAEISGSVPLAQQFALHSENVQKIQDERDAKKVEDTSNKIVKEMIQGGSEVAKTSSRRSYTRTYPLSEKKAVSLAGEKLSRPENGFLISIKDSMSCACGSQMAYGCTCDGIDKPVGVDITMKW